MDTVETRYCGTLELTITYSDETERYNVTITEINDDARFEAQDGIGLSPHDAARLAVDSPEAFDRVARAAVSFASNEDSAIETFAECDGNGNHVVRRERASYVYDRNKSGDA